MSFGVPLLESESEFPSYPHYPHAGVERIWHIQDSHGQILALSEVGRVFVLQPKSVDFTAKVRETFYGVPPWLSSGRQRHWRYFFFCFITLGLELSDTKVYEP